MSIKKLFTLLGVAWLSINASLAATHYVKVGGTGSGASWADATGNLHAALAASTNGDQIWIAEGTYYASSLGNPDELFMLVDGITILGGFPAVGTPGLTDRDPATYPSVVSGDIGATGVHTDNTGILFLGINLVLGVTIDGVTMEYVGNVNALPSNYQGFLNGSPSEGAAIFIDCSNAAQGNITVNDCRFENNQGEAINIYARNGGTGNLAITDCYFSGNSGNYCILNDAQSGGFATGVPGDITMLLTTSVFENNINDVVLISNFGESGEVDATIDRCVFRNNGTVNSLHGCLLLTSIRSGNFSTTTISNSLFDGNTSSASNGNGGVYIFSNLGGTQTLNYINNTAYNNSGGDAGAIASFASPPPAGGSVTMNIYNSIFWANSGSQNPDIFATQGYLYFDNSSLQAATCPNPGGYFCGSNLLYATDPLFTNAPAGDFTLQSGSPCIDAGNNAQIPAGITLDLPGNSRIESGTVDMGALEAPFVCPPILHVNKLATGANNGSDWANAFTDLQAALAFARANSSCVTEIWVAAGTYYPSPPPASGSGAPFALVDGIKHYGGFPNVGNPTFADRNWTTHQTILSGEIQQDGNINNNSNPVVLGGQLSAGTVTDGFYIENGRQGIQFNYSGGNCQALFRDCNIRNNRGFVPGMAVAVSGNGNFGAQFFDVIWENNHNGGLGGAVVSLEGTNAGVYDALFEHNRWSNNQASCLLTHAQFGTQMVPVFLGCQFNNNSSIQGGGGVVANITTGFGFARPEFTNCLAYSNSALSGGMLANASGGGDAIPVFNNCTFYNHSASLHGGFVVNGTNNGGPGIPEFNNCIIWQNFAPLGFVVYQDDAMFCGDPTEVNFNHCMIDANDCFDVFAFDTFLQSQGLFPCAMVNCLGGNSFNWAPPFFNNTIPGAEDFRLQPASFGIDEGNNGLVPFYAGTDLAGNNRIDGISVDKGCYENFPGALRTVMCHYDSNKPWKSQTLDLPAPAVPAHLGHGDYFGDCSYLSAKQLQPSTHSLNSVENHQEVLTALWPNPASEQVAISVHTELLEEHNTVELTLHSAVGAQVLSTIRLNTYTHTIDVSDLAAGMYTYRVVADGVMKESGKLIVK